MKVWLLILLYWIALFLLMVSLSSEGFHPRLVFAILIYVGLLKILFEGWAWFRGSDKENEDEE